MKSRLILVLDAQPSLSSTTKVSKTMAFSNEFWDFPWTFSEGFYCTSYLTGLNRSLYVPTCTKPVEMLSPQILNFPLNKNYSNTEKTSTIKLKKQRHNIYCPSPAAGSSWNNQNKLKAYLAKCFFRYLLPSLHWIPRLKFLLWRWQIPAAPHPSPSLKVTPRSTQFLSVFPLCSAAASGNEELLLLCSRWSPEHTLVCSSTDEVGKIPPQ